MSTTDSATASPSSTTLKRRSNKRRPASRATMVAGAALFAGALLAGGCFDDADTASQSADAAGSCSISRDKMGVHVGAVPFAQQSAALDKVDAGWVRVLHQFKRCNDRLPAGCSQQAQWSCAGANGAQLDLDDYVTQITDYQGKGVKVLFNVNAWAIPACVEASASHPPPTPSSANGPAAEQWLQQYKTELTRLVIYLKNNSALPDAIQIGNEPNGIEEMDCGFFGRMLLAADGILRAHAPSVKRVVGGVINPFPHEMGADCLDAAAARAEIDWQQQNPTLDVPNTMMRYDGVAVHMYGIRNNTNYQVNDNGFTVRQRWDGAVDNVDAVTEPFGFSPKIWVTETGGPLEENQSSHASETYKAQFLEYTLPYLASKASVERVFVYRLISKSEHLGLVAANGSTVNEALHTVNTAVCGGINPGSGSSTVTTGGGAGCSANGWCPCPNNDKWYDQNSSGNDSKAVVCDGQTPTTTGGGGECTTPWCECPNKDGVWYDKNVSSGPHSQAVKCDGATTTTGGGNTCTTAWCECPNKDGVWYDTNVSSGPHSQAVKCDGATTTTGGGSGCTTDWCECPNKDGVWYNTNQSTGPDSFAGKCGDPTCTTDWCECPNKDGVWYNTNQSTGPDSFAGKCN